MAVFQINAEHVSSFRIEDIKAFCKKNKIRVTKIWMDEVFKSFVHVRIVGETKRVANKVQDFIWDEVNGGAFCEIIKVKT